MKWAEIQRLDAGRHFDAVFGGEPIPSLEAFLRAALVSGVGVNLELKATPDHAEFLTRMVLEVARAVWHSDPSTPDASLPTPLFLSSFVPDALATAARLAPDWPRGLLLDRIEPGWADNARRVEAVAIVVDHRLLTSPDAVTALGVDDRAVLAYTVNDPARATQLRRWGVASIMTDRPDAEMAAAMAVKIRLTENNFIYGSMVTSCDGRGHNKHHGVTGSALSVTHSMIGRVP
jgi:glycerophosphoryl diester phosphodiesterase